MRILIVGASSGTGRCAVEACLRGGHQVTAFARSAGKIEARAGLLPFRGDAMSPADVDAAIRGQEAVIVTLGIRENPLRVRLGLQQTPLNVRSQGTANVVAAMQRHGVRRLIAQTTYGIGTSRGRLSLGWALTFKLLLGPQIADSERQEMAVRSSGLDWTLVQPVGLVDRDTGRPPFTSETSRVRSMQVSRLDVAEFLMKLATESPAAQRCIAISS